MSKEYIFLMVALIDEIEKVVISINKINKLYDVYKFAVIVPEKDLRAFENIFRSNLNVHIINENYVVNKNDFNNLCDSYLGTNKDYGCFRKNW